MWQLLFMHTYIQFKVFSVQGAVLWGYSEKPKLPYNRVDLSC